MGPCPDGKFNFNCSCGVLVPSFCRTVARIALGTKPFERYTGSSMSVQWRHQRSHIKMVQASSSLKCKVLRMAPCRVQGSDLGVSVLGFKVLGIKVLF